MIQNAQGFFETSDKPFDCLCGQPAFVRLKIEDNNLITFIVKCSREGCPSIQHTSGKNLDRSIFMWNENVEKTLDHLKEKIEKQKEIAR